MRGVAPLAAATASSTLLHLLVVPPAAATAPAARGASDGTRPYGSRGRGTRGCTWLGVGLGLGLGARG